MKTVHVYPLDDLIEHEREGDECVCGPDFEWVEFAERGEPLPTSGRYPGG